LIRSRMMADMGVPMSVSGVVIVVLVFINMA
jgi:hypothetical protein